MSWFFLPLGTRVYNKLMEFIKEQYWKRGYTEVSSTLSSHIFNAIDKCVAAKLTFHLAGYNAEYVQHETVVYFWTC